jgi:hypothetical protein
VNLLDQLRRAAVGHPPIDDGQLGSEVDDIDIVELEVIAGCHRVASHFEHGIEE